MLLTPLLHVHINEWNGGSRTDGGSQKSKKKERNGETSREKERDGNKSK